MSQPHSRWSAELSLMRKAIVKEHPLLMLLSLLALVALAISCSFYHAQRLLETATAVTEIPSLPAQGAAEPREREAVPAIVPTYPVRSPENTEASSDLLLKIAKVLCCANIEFEENTENLTPNGKAVLNDLVPFFTEHPAARLFVDGHTDALGALASNLQLSVSRANSARNFLLSRGVNPEQLIARGFGADQPIADNSTEDGRRRNRRIEFRL